MTASVVVVDSESRPPGPEDGLADWFAQPAGADWKHFIVLTITVIAARRLTIMSPGNIQQNAANRAAIRTSFAATATRN